MGRLWEGRHRTPEGVKHDYNKFGASVKAKKDRAARNKARRQALREGRVQKNDGTEIDHKDSNPRNGVKSNLRVVTRKFNRSRKENSRRRGSRRIKSSWGL